MSKKVLKKRGKSVKDRIYTAAENSPVIPAMEYYLTEYLEM